jgi:hypothetical protein
LAIITSIARRADAPAAAPSPQMPEVPSDPPPAERDALDRLFLGDS